MADNITIWQINDMEWWVGAGTVGLLSIGQFELTRNPAGETP